MEAWIKNSKTISIFPTLQNMVKISLYQFETVEITDQEQVN